MDLNSLPDEMLTIILKKTSIKLLLNLRRMNKRIDRIARRAGLRETIAVESLEIGAFGVIVVFEESPKTVVSGTQIVFEWDRNNEMNRFNNIKKWISRVKIQKTLPISNYFNVPNSKFDVMELFGKTFAKNLRNVTEIKLYNFTFTHPMGVVLLLLCQRCPRLEVLKLLECNFVDNGPVTWKKKLLKRKWKWLQIANSKNPLKSIVLDDKFLFDVVAHCDSCEIHMVENDFSATGVINLLKTLVVGNGFWHSITLCSMVPMNIPRAEFERVLSVEIPEMQINGRYRYTLLYKTDTKMIKFEMGVPLTTFN